MWLLRFQAPGAALRAETEAVAVIANEMDVYEHDYVLANAPSPAMEVFVDTENVLMQRNVSSSVSQISQFKKAKLLADLPIDDNSLSSSPDLHHKLP